MLLYLCYNANICPFSEKPKYFTKKMWAIFTDRPHSHKNIYNLNYMSPNGYLVYVLISTVHAVTPFTYFVSSLADMA